MFFVKLGSALIICLAGVVGSITPLYLSDTALPFGEALAAGVFLSAGFIHLLPDSAEDFGQIAKAEGVSEDDDVFPTAYLLCALGYLATFSINLLIRISDSAHALLERQAKLTSAKALVLLLCFSLTTPSGIILGMLMVSNEEAHDQSNKDYKNGSSSSLDSISTSEDLIRGIFTALASGTFIYIASSSLNEIVSHLGSSSSSSLSPSSSTPSFPRSDSGPTELLEFGHPSSSSSSSAPTSSSFSSIGNHTHSHDGGSVVTSASVSSSLKALVLFSMLSIHSLLAGLALGVSDQVGDAIGTLLAILAHKIVASFSLGLNVWGMVNNDHDNNHRHHHHYDRTDLGTDISNVDHHTRSRNKRKKKTKKKKKKKNKSDFAYLDDEEKYPLRGGSEEPLSINDTDNKRSNSLSNGHPDQLVRATSLSSSTSIPDSVIAVVLDDEVKHDYYNNNDNNNNNNNNDNDSDDDDDATNLGRDKNHDSERNISIDASCKLHVQTSFSANNAQSERKITDYVYNIEERRGRRQQQQQQQGERGTRATTSLAKLGIAFIGFSFMSLLALWV